MVPYVDPSYNTAPYYSWYFIIDLIIIGLHYKGVYMGHLYPNFCLCAFWGPYSKPHKVGNRIKAK